MNKLSNLHIAIGTYNPRKLRKSGKYICKGSPYLISNAVEKIW
jgi:hypothetical protein